MLSKTGTNCARRLQYLLLFLLSLAAPVLAQEQGGGEANLKLPDLRSASFVGGMNGHTLLLGGLVVSFLGLAFGLMIFVRLRNMPVHASMREVSELIYETCKTYLATQGKFLIILELFIAVIIVFYFGFLQGLEAYKVGIILLFSVIGISGSFMVAAFGMRVNTFANSRTAFAALRGKPFPCYEIPLQAGMSIGMLLVSVELLIMLFILLFVPGDLAGACFTGFALITFILLAVREPLVQVELLVWIFSMRVMMVISSGIGYFINGAIAKARYGNAEKMNFEAPLTSLVWLTSILSIVLTYVISSMMIPSLAGDTSLWWKLATVISCGTLAGALIPEFVKVFTSTNSRHVREIVTSSRKAERRSTSSP